MTEAFREYDEEVDEYAQRWPLGSQPDPRYVVRSVADTGREMIARTEIVTSRKNGSNGARLSPTTVKIEAVLPLPSSDAQNFTPRNLRDQRLEPRDLSAQEDIGYPSRRL